MEVHDGYQLVSNLNGSENELLGPADFTDGTLQEEFVQGPSIQKANFAKRQGAQEVDAEYRKLCKRHEDLKCSIDNQIVKAQELLCQVQKYETPLNDFVDWLRKVNESVNLINSVACTSEDINTELAKIQV